MSIDGKHTISMRVHDRPGVLSRIAQVFARRGFNIDSLVVSAGHQLGFSRMTISCEGDPSQLEQIVKQLEKLVDTVHATEHMSETVPLTDSEHDHKDIELAMKPGQEDQAAQTGWTIDEIREF